ncbi:hypothetical protein C2S52_013505 [Perilla frutescens var. hirtella]|nr:hypothetical protein C2S51_015800 [Perilla frutescens var. frutescens]KAH6775944.1 hypothetical protein C2S52_013505 [Perilla frutescens var. hirtella]
MRVRSWYSPEKGVFRLDVDASVNANTNLSGIGAVVWDWEGKLQAALAMPISLPSSVLEAEIHAIIHEVRLCLQEGFGPVVIFSDSLLTIRIIKGKHDGDSYLEGELPTIMELAKTGVICDFKHMYRETNFIMHSVAQFGTNCTGLITWNSVFSQWLEALV